MATKKKKTTKRKVGRPSNYDFKLCEEICEKVADGNNIKKVLNSNEKYPSFPTWCKWKRENSELLNLYVNSIQDKSESVDDQIDDISHDLRTGKIDASTANVLIQTLKWKAGKYYPKMFGDNKNVDLTNSDGSLNMTPEERQKRIQAIKDKL